MKRFRKLKLCIIGLGILAALVFAFVWWGTVLGVPGALLQALTGRVEAETGLEISLSKALFRNERMIELTNLHVQDEAQILTLRGDRVIAIFPESGWRGVPELTLFDGAVELRNDGALLAHAKLSHARITPEEDAVSVAAAGELGSLQLDLRTRLVGKPARTGNRKVSLGFLKLSPQNRQHLDELKELLASADRGALRCRLDLFLPQPLQSRGSVDLQVSDFLLRGIAVDSLQVSATALGGGLQGTYAVTADGGQQLSGTFSADSTALRAQLLGAAWPERWLNAFGKAIPSERFEVRDLVTVRGDVLWPLQQPWTAAEASAEVRTSVRIQDALVDRFQAQLQVRDGTLHFENAQGMVNGDSWLKADGQVDLRTWRLYTSFDATADPSIIAQFSNNKGFREDYTQLMTRFEFSQGQYPVARGDLYVCPEWERGGLILSLNVDAQNVVYAGKRLDRMSADLLVDVPDALVVIENVCLQLGRKSFRGRLAREFLAPHINRPRAMEFVARSDLATDDLFEAIELKWGQRQTQRGHRALEVEAVGRGRITMDSPDHHLDLRYRSPRFDTKAGPVMDIVGEVKIRGNKITTRNRGTHCDMGGWQIRDPELEFVYLPGAPSLQMKGAHMQRQNLQAEQVLLQGHYASSPSDTLIGLTLQAAKMQLDEIELTPASCQITFTEGGFQAEVKGERAQLADDLAATTVEVELEQTRQGLNGALALQEVCGDAIAAHEVTGTFQQARGKGAPLLLVGKASAWRLLPLEGVGASASLHARVEQDGWTLTANTDQASFLDGGKVEGVQAVLTQKGGVPLAADIDISGLTYGQWQATDASAEGTITADATRLDVTTGRVKRGLLDATDCTAGVAYSRGDLALINASADLYDGQLRGDFFMNLDEQRGTTFWVLRQASMRAIDQARADSKKKPATVKDGEKDPKLTGHLNLSLHGWGDTLSLSGSGQADIVDGNFLRYRIPVFSDFLVLVSKTRLLGFITTPISDLTRISKLTADVEFDKTLMIIRNLRTNGDVIAVSGEGYYDWKKPWLDIGLHAESLPGLWRRVPLLKDPLRVLLARRAKGSLDDLSWEEFSGIRNLFRDTSPPKENEHEAD